MKANKALSRLCKPAGFKPRNKNCWTNAINLLLEFGGKDLLYVEGFAVGEAGVPIEHGWIECKGEVVEITPSWAKQEGVEYFAGVYYSYDEVIKNMSGKVPFVWQDGKYGMETPAYINASREAYKLIGIEQKASQK